MIVDDDISLSRLVQIALEETGRYAATTENYSHDALATILRVRPNLILLDVHMPGMDGGDVARLVRAHPALQNTHIIFFTALISRQEAPDTIVMRGGEMFLSKPIQLPKLIGCIDAVVNENSDDASCGVFPARIGARVSISGSLIAAV